MTVYHRRQKSIGTPMFVNLPQHGYEDTGEGGLAFYLVIEKQEKEDRCVCIPGGGLLWGYIDVCVSPKKLDKQHSILVDAGLLIGSTGQSLWSDDKESYFHPNLSDLTSEGKRIYHTLKRIYGKVTIVTLLDT